MIINYVAANRNQISGMLKDTSLIPDPILAKEVHMVNILFTLFYVMYKCGFHWEWKKRENIFQSGKSLGMQYWISRGNIPKILEKSINFNMKIWGKMLQKPGKSKIHRNIMVPTRPEKKREGIFQSGEMLIRFEKSVNFTQNTNKIRNQLKILGK